MVTLVLIRHGESTANAAGLLAGRTPGVELTAAGREQIRRLAGVFPFERVDRLHHSPLLRCRQTAEEFSSRVPVGSMQVDDGLCEVDYGTWSNARLEDLKDSSAWSAVASCPSSVVFPSGESLAAAAERAVRTARGFVAELAAGTTAGQPGGQSGGQAGESEPVGVLISHGDIIKAILADALAMDLDRFQRIAVAPGSLSVIRCPGDGHPVVTAMSVTADGRQAASPDLGGGN